MADISALSFGTTVDMLANAMRGAGANQDQLANNIANVNTPGFKRSTVSFKDALAQAAGGTPADSDTLPMATDNDRQFAIGDAQAPVPFDPQAQTDNSTQMRSDGNNVDIDQEMAQLSQNSAYSQTMAQLLSTQFGMYHTAITDEPR